MKNEISFTREFFSMAKSLSWIAILLAIAFAGLVGYQNKGWTGFFDVLPGTAGIMFGALCFICFQVAWTRKRTGQFPHFQGTDAPDNANGPGVINPSTGQWMMGDRDAVGRRYGE
jgi:hypothetical protein